MTNAAASARELIATLDQMIGELSGASEAMYNAIAIGDAAIASVDELSAKSTSIECIAVLIEEITDRSEVLSLNASIEAARAGPAGDGFGVVANEMKALSRQTASATIEIFSHIDAIKSARKEALDANSSMLRTFESVSEVIQLVRNDVASKSTAMAAITQQVDDTANEAQQSRKSIAAINDLAGGLSQQVTRAGTSLHDLSGQISAMRQGTDKFLSDLSMRAGPNEYGQMGAVDWPANA